MFNKDELLSRSTEYTCIMLTPEDLSPTRTSGKSLFVSSVSQQMPHATCLALLYSVPIPE